MLAYTKYCILRLSMRKCADLKTFTCSVCKKKEYIAVEELSPYVQGLKEVPSGCLHLHFYVLYISGLRGELLAGEYTARDHSKVNAVKPHVRRRKNTFYDS